MAKIKSFDKYYHDYERWFDKHPHAYQSELKAVGHFIDPSLRTLEIGMGSGRFAEPMGIEEGIEPSYEMRKLAHEKGLKAEFGTAEQLPVEDETYDLALMVTTICFVDNPTQAVAEMFRILKPGGIAVIGFVDKESPVGQVYQKHKEESRFYYEANFFSASEIENLLKQQGFGDIQYVQTLFGKLDEVQQVQDYRPGYGEGSFVVARGVKK
ncbi:MAG TPA: methyltransferase domain-containing protein [Bacteroidales bacterium]|nr:methyltransferase domain-containing protein [Bacteroidales bacterium]